MGCPQQKFVSDAAWKGSNIPRGTPSVASQCNGKAALIPIFIEGEVGLAFYHGMKKERKCTLITIPKFLLDL